MRQSLSRHAVGQPATSRSVVAPPRALSGVNPPPNAPTTPSPFHPASQASTPPIQPPPPSTPAQAPAVAVAPAFPAATWPPAGPPVEPGNVQPINGSPYMGFGGGLQLNGSATAAFGGAPQVPPSGVASGITPSDPSQRMLMDYLAMMQSQMAAMNQVVASTVAHSQALTAQNQALVEELRALKHHVEGLTAARSTWAAAPTSIDAPQAAVAGPAVAPTQVPPSEQPGPTQQAEAAPALAAPPLGLSYSTPAAATSAPGSALTNVPAAAPSLPSLGLQATSPPPVPMPAPQQAVDAELQQQQQQPSAAVGAQVAFANEVQLELMSMLASELAGLSDAGSTGAGASLEGPSPLAARKPAEPVPGAPAAAPDPTGGGDDPAPSAPRATAGAGPAAPSAPPATAPSAAPVLAPAPAARPPGRGGRYVGPPRVDTYPKAVPGAAKELGGSSSSPSWRGQATNAARSIVDAAAPSSSSSGSSPAAGVSAGAWVTSVSGAGSRFSASSGIPRSAPGARFAGRGEKQVAAAPAQAPGAAAAAAAAAPAAAAATGAGDGPAAAAFPTEVAVVSVPPLGEHGPAAAAAAAATSTAVEKLIRRCGTAAELRAVVEEERLSPQQAVLAAQQLPRIARLAQERQQEVQPEGPGQAAVGKGGAPAAAETELLALRELFLRLLTRFTSPAALSALRPAFLPNYLSLAAVSAELRQPPSRAFAGTVRQLVTQHVADVAPDLAAAGVAAVAQLDGTVAPGLLERSCKIVVDAATAVADSGGGGTAATSARLLGWKALVAAGHLAPLGRVAVEAARQVLSGAAAAAEATPAAAPPDPESVMAAAQGVLACSAAGVAVPRALVLPLEAASRCEDLLAAVGPAGQLLVAKALVAAEHRPEDAWLDVWEDAVVVSLPRASPAQVAVLAASLHSLTCASGGDGDGAATACASRNSGRAPQGFVAAAAERLLAAGPSAGMASGAAACALALHIGELAAGGGTATAASSPAPVPPADATALASVLLSVATAGLASLDLPDLAALVSGLSLLDVRAPAEVWSALLSRATDAPEAAAAATAAARRALEVGLPSGVKPTSLEHFLSVGSKHVAELPAASLVGLLGLAAAVQGKLRQGLMASVLSRLYDQAAALGPRDAAFLFAAVDSLGLPLTQPLVARPLAVAGGAAAPAAAGSKEDGKTGDDAAGLTPFMVLRRAAESALVPELVLPALGLENSVKWLELVARLQQAVSAAVAADGGAAGGEEARETVGSGGGGGHIDGDRLVPRSRLLALLDLLQPLLEEASPQAVATLVGSAAALELPVQPAWLGAVVAVTLAAPTRPDPLTWSRIAAAVTRCEQLAGVAPGTAGGGSWLDVFVDDIQRKLAAAPPPALALTLQVLVAHGRQPSTAWAEAFLAAAMPSLEAPLPLTQAQAAGAAAVAASFAAGRARPTVRSGAAAQGPAHAASRGAPAAAAGATPPASISSGGSQGAIATAFTPPQLAQLLGGVAALQLQQYVTPAWLAAAIRQVEGRAVHFTYRDLAEVLYGIVRLGGVVRDSLCNQLFIMSQAKMAAAPPALLARMLAVAAAAEGRKVSGRWWEEVQKALVTKLADATAQAPAAGAASSLTAGGWQTSDLCLVVSSVLALHDQKEEADIGAPLAASLAAVVSYVDVAAALPADAAVSYVEACAELPQLGRPPSALLEQYVSYSIGLLSKFAVADDSQVAAALAEQMKQPSTAAESTSGKGGARDKRERKRARDRAAKHAAAGALPSPLLEHLQSAVAVGKMLVDLPAAERPAAAAPWLAALAAAGASAASSLPVTCAADVLWLIARLESSGGASSAAASVLGEQVQVLAARVGGATEVPTVGAGTTAPQRPAPAPVAALAPEAVVDTVWALQAMGVAPGEGLLRGLARALPRRLAALSPAEALQLLQTLANAGEAGARAVAEAEAAASGIAATAATSTPSGSRSGPPKFSVELGRFLEIHLPALSDEAMVGALSKAAALAVSLPPAVTSTAFSRLAASASANSLPGAVLYGGVTGLRALGVAAPPPDELEALCDAAAERALDGTLGGVLQIARVSAALYDMGARPGPEWLTMMSEALVDDLVDTPTQGGVRRPQLTARGLIISLYELSSRFNVNYVMLAMAACRAAMEDLEGQLARAEGRLVPEPLPLRPDVARMVPVPDAPAEVGTAAAAAAASATSLKKQAGHEGPQQQQEQQQLLQQLLSDEDDDEEGAEAEEELRAVEELMRLDPALLAPLELSELVQLLAGLDCAHQEPPASLWGLLERALRPALQQQQQQQQQQQVLEVNDKALAELLVQMYKLRCFASEGFLTDLEDYLSRRMPLQGPQLLAGFAGHCRATSYLPDPKFMRLFTQRVEEVAPQMDTDAAVVLMGFLLADESAAAEAENDRRVDSARAAKSRQSLMQALLDRTTGEDLLRFDANAGGDGLEVALLLTALLGSFGLRLPYSSDPERQAAWLTALQALTLGCMDSLGWHHVAAVLNHIHAAEQVPTREWLAEFYRRLEASAATAPPYELSDAATVIAATGYQAALSPTLPARLAQTLETRMREFGSTDPRVIPLLLHAVGSMGHTARTEVLQAAEVLMARSLARAVEVLKEALEAGEVDERLEAAASAAAGLVQEQALLYTCMAFKRQGYRPGSQLSDALTAAAWQLHQGTALRDQVERGQPPPPAALVCWSQVLNVASVLDALAEWGVKPEQYWCEGAAMALAVVSYGSKPRPQDVDGELGLMLAALAALEQWDHPLGGSHAEILQSAVEDRVRACRDAGFPVNMAMAQALQAGLEDKRMKAVERDAAGASASASTAARTQPPSSWSSSIPDDVTVERALSRLAAVQMAADAEAAMRPAAQPGPVATAEFFDLGPGAQSEEGQAAGRGGAEGRRGRAKEQGPVVSVADAATEIAEAARAIVQEPKPAAAAAPAAAARTAAATAAAAAVKQDDARASRSRPPPPRVPASPAPEAVAADALAAAERVAVVQAPEPLAQPLAAELPETPAAKAAAANKQPAAAANSQASDVEAPSTKVSFRRLTAEERAATAARGMRRTAPPASPASTGAATDERTRMAISQLLQFMRQSSRPPRRAVKLNQAADAEADADDQEDVGSDSDGAESALGPAAGRLRAAAAAAAAAASAPAARSAPGSAPGKAAGGGGSSKAGARFRSQGGGPGGFRRAAEGASTAQTTRSAAAAVRGRQALVDPFDPQTWNLLDLELGSSPPPPPPPASGPQPQRSASVGRDKLPVVEPEVLEP